MRRFIINDIEITQNSKPFIIAEIGNNCFIKGDMSRSIELCKAMITRAKLNGAHAVKLQKRDPYSLFTASMFNKPYNGENSFGPTYGRHREALEFDENAWILLKNHAESAEIMLFSTAFDLNSVDFLEDLNMPMYKVASGCLRDTQLISRIADTGKPIIVSTGGAEWEDIDRIHTMLSDRGSMFCFLHCTMQYPTAAENVNLRVIEQMRLRYSSTVIGFSDHTIGTWAIPAAYGFGAQVFEKHFTSNKSLPGPDHVLSIEPDELQHLTHTLDRIYAAKGMSDKHFMECEQAGYYKMGKSIYTARPIARGSLITYDDLCIKSPADGMPPYRMLDVAGRIASRDMPEEWPITIDDVGGGQR